MKAIEYNSQTGEITERDMTPEEIAQLEAMQVEMEEEAHPTLEQRVTNIEQVTAEVITILNDKGIAP
jgi:thymidylate synthase